MTGHGRRRDGEPLAMAAMTPVSTASKSGMPKHVKSRYLYGGYNYFAASSDEGTEYNVGDPVVFDRPDRPFLEEAGPEQDVVVVLPRGEGGERRGPGRRLARADRDRRAGGSARGRARCRPWGFLAWGKCKMHVLRWYGERPIRHSE